MVGHMHQARSIYPQWHSVQTAGYIKETRKNSALSGAVSPSMVKQPESMLNNASRTSQRRQVVMTKQWRVPRARANQGTASAALLLPVPGRPPFPRSFLRLPVTSRDHLPVWTDQQLRSVGWP
uniref:Uncharacterized protein n=1 Tax=Zea mays TaxID=4577 RepID=C4J137_MAIZE|nr:unknown [Zea mays]